MSDFYFLLNLLANLLQIENYNLNLRDKTNTEINNHLEKQDRLLTEEILQKLNLIVKQNEEIIELLKNKSS